MQKGKYSLASRNRPSKMKRIKGRLWEVVAFKNRITGGSLPRRSLGTSTIMQFLSYTMCISKYMLYIISSIVHTANTEIRECVKWSLTRA